MEDCKTKIYKSYFEAKIKWLTRIYKVDETQAKLMSLSVLDEKEFFTFRKVILCEKAFKEQVDYQDYLFKSLSRGIISSTPAKDMSQTNKRIKTLENDMQELARITSLIAKKVIPENQDDSGKDDSNHDNVLNTDNQEE